MSGMLFVLLALVISFAVSVILCPFVIPFLRKLKFGQTILEEGPKWHEGKKGTPTMGGIVIIIAFVVAALSFSLSGITSGDYRVVIVIIGTLLFGAIGFADDFIKVVMKRNLGLSVVQKFVLQFLFAGAFVAAMAVMGYTTTEIKLPFTDTMLDLGIFYYPLTILVIVFFNNSFNLADGIDGLLSAESVPAFATVALVALSMGFDDMAIMITSVIGAVLGFLIFNMNPAKIFMGDTGSLFLGGLFVLSGVALDLTLMIFLAGIMMVVESLSVLLQVGYYKISHGKRLFKMSPIHHHFELSGWSENKIVVVFTVVTFVFCLIAFFAFGV
ncbi:MAG: phospho-N-acetylmuramoyl-pentapeptide-transferase [Clostridia bacterium]|nr:phospho-N-acetylmuramoyl-pentapeptide-transferase [Clostridia bacterium]